jgi:integrase/recombinase XerD
MVDHGFSPISINGGDHRPEVFLRDDTGSCRADEQDAIGACSAQAAGGIKPRRGSRLIAAAGNLKHQTALAVAYGTGLRAGEVVALKVSDIDSERMTLRIEQGKGSKDRYAMLSPVLLDSLRTWWKTARAQGKMLNGGWLFPGLNPMDQLSTPSIESCLSTPPQKRRRSTSGFRCTPCATVLRPTCWRIRWTSA